MTSPWFAHDALAGRGCGGDDDDDDAPALRREPLPGANSTGDEKTKAEKKNARAPSSVFGEEVDAEMRGMRFVVAGAGGVAREVTRQLATVGARARIHDGDSSDGRAGRTRRVARTGFFRRAVFFAKTKKKMFVRR